MRILIFLVCIALFLCPIQNLKAQKNNQIWSHKIFDDTITFNFEQDAFKVDTIDSYEGYVFYFTLSNDSSYFRMNYTTPNAKFECCKEDSIFVEINKTSQKGITDTNGKVKLSNLHWREIKNEDIEIIYNDCTEKNLIFFNKIMDSIYATLINNKKH